MSNTEKTPVLASRVEQIVMRLRLEPEFDTESCDFGRMVKDLGGHYILFSEYKKLSDLCDEFFTDAMIQPYAGAVRECRFCGATQSRDGSFPNHSVADCPVMKYKIILGA